MTKADQQARIEELELADEQAADLIESSGGYWKEDIFCIAGGDLMNLLREAVRAALSSLPSSGRVKGAQPTDCEYPKCECPIVGLNPQCGKRAGNYAAGVLPSSGEKEGQHG